MRPVHSFGYKIPALIADFTGRYAPAGDEPVLDAGAGTGIMGEILEALGYTNVEALDLSEGMLAVADARASTRRCAA